jgi:hypothetical protein
VPCTSVCRASRACPQLEERQRAVPAQWVCRHTHQAKDARLEPVSEAHSVTRQRKCVHQLLLDCEKQSNSARCTLQRFGETPTPPHRTCWIWARFAVPVSKCTPDSSAGAQGCLPTTPLPSGARVHSAVGRYMARMAGRCLNASRTASEMLTMTRFCGRGAGGSHAVCA